MTDTTAMPMVVFPRTSWTLVETDAGTCTRQRSTAAAIGPPCRQAISLLPRTTARDDYVLALPDEDEVTEVALRVMRLRDEICGVTGFTREQLARLIGVGRRSITNWANGTVPPTPEHLLRLKRMSELVRFLVQLRRTPTADLLLEDDALDEVVAWVQRSERPDIGRILGLSTPRSPSIRVTVDVTPEQAKHLADALRTAPQEHKARRADEGDADMEQAPAASRRRDPRRFAPVTRRR